MVTKASSTVPVEVKNVKVAEVVKATGRILAWRNGEGKTVYTSGGLDLAQQEVLGVKGMVDGKPSGCPRYDYRQHAREMFNGMTADAMIKAFIKSIDLNGHKDIIVKVDGFENLKPNVVLTEVPSGAEGPIEREVSFLAITLGEAMERLNRLSDPDFGKGSVPSKTSELKATIASMNEQQKKIAALVAAGDLAGLKKLLS